MEKNNFGAKKFFASSFGRIVLTILMYAIVFGICYALIMTELSFFVLGFALLFAFFGWRALSKITPQMFLVMSVGGWAIYFLVKGLLSIAVGLFVAPYIIGKWLANKISLLCERSVEKEQNKKLSNDNQHSHKKAIDSEFDDMMEAVCSLNKEQLEEMHDVLAKYVREMPLPDDSTDYLEEIRRFENSPLIDGVVYGCKTYGEAQILLKRITNILDDIEA